VILQIVSTTYYAWKNNTYMSGKSEGQTKWHGCLVAYWPSVSHTLMAPSPTTPIKCLWKLLALKKAQACFTQANDTPFLTPPLISKLGLFNSNDLPFDEIATGQYQLPDGIQAPRYYYNTCNDQQKFLIVSLL